MNDYEPLDISPLCNAGMDALSGEEATPTGSVTINGLPFQIGPKDGGDRCFVVLDGSSGTLKLDVGGSAHSVIVAHRLLESDLQEGGVGGKDGSRSICSGSPGAMRTGWPSEEKFDISGPSERLGQPPAYRAVTRYLDRLPPRHEGPWGRDRAQADGGDARGRLELLALGLAESAPRPRGRGDRDRPERPALSSSPPSRWATWTSIPSSARAAGRRG